MKLDYVENLCFVMLNENQKEAVDSASDIDISRAIVKDDS